MGIHWQSVYCFYVGASRHQSIMTRLLFDCVVTCFNLLWNESLQANIASLSEVSSSLVLDLFHRWLQRLPDNNREITLLHVYAQWIGLQQLRTLPMQAGIRDIKVIELEGQGTRMWNSHMMTSSNGNIFRVTGHLCGEFTGPRWISHTKVSDAELWYFLWPASE